MTGKQLRNSILQWAIQGKLVPQDPNDEPASVLLERIRAEKARLVKEKKIKKDKNESIIFRGEDNSYYEKMADGTVRCIDSEIPFEIPGSWAWVRIRTISQSYIGLTYSPADVSASGTIVLRSSNIQNGKIDLSDLVRVSKEIPSKLNVAKNDIIICARNGSAKLVGKSAIVRKLEEPMTFGAFMAICKTPLYEYVYAIFQSDLFFAQLRGVSSTTTINQLTQNSFNNFIIPIPPIEEQGRIIRKINQLLPLVEQYGHKQDTLLMLNSNIGVNLRKSILQEAIQGRLVPQIASEGTAEVLLDEIRAEKMRLIKEGKLKKSSLANDSRIFRGEDNRYYVKTGSETDCIDEILLDIPSTWECVTLGELIVDSTGLSYKKENLADKSGPFIRVLRGGNIEDGIMRFRDDDVFISAKYVPHNLLLTKGTYISPAVSSLEKIGKTAIVDRNYTDTVVGGFVLILTPTFCDTELGKYLYYFFQSAFYQNYCRKITKKSGQAFYNLSRKKLVLCPVPIPPKAELKRILYTLEKVLAGIMSR